MIRVHQEALKTTAKHLQQIAALGLESEAEVSGAAEPTQDMLASTIEKREEEEDTATTEPLAKEDPTKDAQ